MPLSGLPRNVQVYDLADPGGARVLVAGLMQLNTTTVADLYRCLDICFQAPQSPNFRLVNVHGIILDRNPGGSIVPVEDFAVISTRLPLILFSYNWSRWPLALHPGYPVSRSCPCEGHIGWEPRNRGGIASFCLHCPVRWFRLDIDVSWTGTSSRCSLYHFAVWYLSPRIPWSGGCPYNSAQSFRTCPNVEICFWRSLVGQ